jgi:calcium permeable stress-gated cation channel
VAVVWLGAFLYLRPRYSWHYAPRSAAKTLRSSDYTTALPNTPLGWFSAFFSIPDHVVLQRQSLDAFFFLRFLKLAVVICLVGCAIVWPILVPVYATGGGGAQQLDAITVGNIAPTANHVNNFRYFALALCAWVYFVFVLFLITRETIFYINLRQAYLMNPAYASKLPSRTVLYVAVPDEFLDESRLRGMLGPTVKHVWFPCETKELDKLVEERDKAAMTLEGAETKLIITANQERIKAGGLHNGTVQEEETGEAGPQNGAAQDLETGEAENSAARWITPKQRPTHRLKPLIGKKVDSITHSREEIARLTPLIEERQAKLRVGDGKKYPAVFVEFDNLSEAQAAYQSLTSHEALKMDPRFTGMHPLEIIWSNLKIRGWERFIRQTVVITIVVVTIIFWSFPVAFVGFLGNLSYWTGDNSPTPWLHFLTKIPSQIFGIISGLLPSVLLSVLMALLPPFLRCK